MVSWLVRLDEQQLAAVRILARHLGKPVSKTIGILCEEYLQGLSDAVVDEAIDDAA